MEMPLIPTLALGLVLAIAFYRFLVYPIFLSPLSRVPSAHWSSAFSSLWILKHRRGQTDTPAVHAAHAKHGSVVRLAPNELSINSVDGGIRTIYAGGYEKGDWYSNVFSNYGVKPMFAMEGHNEHSKRKRMMSNIYAKSTLQKSEGMANLSHILLRERLLPRLSKAAQTGTSLEMYDIFGAITMDFVSCYVFGLSNGSDLLRQPKVAEKFLVDYKGRQVYQFWPQELPSITNFLGKIGLRGLVVPAWVDQANQDIETWIMEMCDRAEQALVVGEQDKQQPEEQPTVYAQLRNTLIKEATKSDLDLPIEQIVRTYRVEIASEMLDHVLAGFDTSSVTLTWLAWELSRPENASWQERLRDELASLGGSTDAKAVDALPGLNAILMETLRLHAAIPGNQPRVTPSAAILGASDCSLKDLPAGIRVQSQAWSLHRNPDVYPSPDLWQPDRWLDADEAQAKEMSRWFWAFGSGGRMCVGSNLAMQEMKQVMVAIWGTFKTDIANDDGMQANGGYIAGPIGADGKYLVLNLKEL